MSIAVPASLEAPPRPRRLHPGARSLVGGPYPNLVPTRRRAQRGAGTGDVVPLAAAERSSGLRGPLPNLVAPR